MGWLKNIFKKQKVEEVKEVVEELDNKNLVCEYCKMSIYGEQKIKTVAGIKYHLRCYRNMLKEARKVAWN